jgi:hypothetical protein
MHLGSFFVDIQQDTSDDPDILERRRVALYGPTGRLVRVSNIIISAGRYEFRVEGPLVRFRNVLGGTPIDVQGMDSTPTDTGDLFIYVNEEPAARVDNLVVTKLPAIQIVQIDIKPGSFPNSINLGSNGTVPVAIISTPSFDATTVNPLGVTLAGSQVQLKGKGTPMYSFEDINGDGLADLVVHVTTEALQLSPTDAMAVLTGSTFGGVPITGSDSVRIVQ